MEHYKKLNIGMENKIIHLQQRLDEQVCIFYLFGLLITCLPLVHVVISNFCKLREKCLLLQIV